MHRRTLLKGAAASLLAAPAIAQPAKTATLRFVPQANLTLLDPIFTTATVTSNHSYYVFDTLYSTAADGKPKPQMAEGHEVSDNGRVWRIRLRDGLKFHDGTPVRAIDCAASLERWSKREPFGQVLAKVVEKWGAVDDRTIEIRLTKPFPLLLEAIGKPDASVAFIMPERLARTDASKQITEMVGSGPYRFIASEYNTGSSAAYEKFDGYVPRSEKPDWATGGKVAYFPRIEWKIIGDPATAGAALQNGEIDWWEQPLSDLLPTLAKDKNIALQIDNPQGRESLMRLNHLQAPFNDVRIRRAVLMAVNQEDYMRATFGDDTSLWSICHSQFPCGTPYETQDNGKWMKSDLNAARAALKEAGYNGQKVVIINPTDFPAIHPLGLVTADTLKKIGMNVDLQETDWGTVVQRRSSREAVEKGGWSIFHTFGSSAAYSTPATSALVRGQGKDGWFGWWDSPKAEQLTQEWLDAPDTASQKRVASELANLAMSEVATIPLGQWYGKTAFRRSITGVLQGVSPYPWNVRPA
ncbi:ABC transporter substrate-binding protein [Limobrevibacterium gyesilva]|uniref:ABC transporter substrate-binding protein n=1 Tax=Limobrevibacterium gyesilva TaxID=2991712 RepID=A0AA41YM37_9PROT|nr:ABC transporter substrate-binding protein [Limobrevibacterium gyesilva]MCW3475001.1 ABC transporter substrate-binding protein [Limobrevibacterium gyesilva]